MTRNQLIEQCRISKGKGEIMDFDVFYDGVSILTEQGWHPAIIGDDFLDPICDVPCDY
jgi:hypothetical protein